MSLWRHRRGIVRDAHYADSGVAMAGHPALGLSAAVERADDKIVVGSGLGLGCRSAAVGTTDEAESGTAMMSFTVAGIAGSAVMSALRWVGALPTAAKSA